MFVTQLLCAAHIIDTYLEKEMLKPNLQSTDINFISDVLKSAIK